MTLQEIRNINTEYQMVLSFSNNNAVVIISEDFDPNSKFMRRSKIRLGMDFEEIQNDDGLMIFRTYRGSGKCDYIVYLSKEYRIIENYRRKTNHSQTIKDTDNKQLSLKDIIKPNKDNILHGYTSVKEYSSMWGINHPDIRKWQSIEYSVKNNIPEWFVVYVAIDRMLQILSRKDQCVHYNQVVIHTDKIIVNIASGKYKTKSKYTKWFKQQLEGHKNILADNNVSLVFKEA